MKALEIPINNPKWFKKLSVEEDKKNMLMDQLQSKYDEIKTHEFGIEDFSAKKSNVFESDSDSADDFFGYVETINRESDSTEWLNKLQTDGTAASKIMEDYKNDEMLPQVFGLNKTKNNNDIL